MSQEELILSPEARRVSQQVVPGSAEARRITGGSGLRLLPLLTSSVQPSAFLRTLLASFLSTEAWNSRVCFLNWKASVTPFNRLLFRLSPLTPDTDGIEFGLLPTAVSSNGHYNKSKGSDKIRPSLIMMAKYGLWPTMTATDSHGHGWAQQKDGSRKLTLVGEARMWPTPTSRDYKDGTAESCQNVPVNGLLGRAIHIWPTPRATDGEKGIRTPEGAQRERERRSNGLDLPTVASGSLNPQFVEWLMGYPTDHTA